MYSNAIAFVGSASRAFTTDPLVQGAAELALGRRIIPAVSLMADRIHLAVVLELGLEGFASILADPIRVVDQSSCRFSSEPDYGSTWGKTQSMFSAADCSRITPRLI